MSKNVLAVILAAGLVVAAIAFIGFDGPESPPPPTQRMPSGVQLEHPKIFNPENLESSRAESIYQAVRSSLQEGYSASSDPIATTYSQWPRYNNAPYRSSTHGRMYVNNYANQLASGYGLRGGGQPLPAGAIIVKDSFIVTEDGTIRSGPLFLMEKMPAGFHAINGDWRYMMIEPNGDVSGPSGPENEGGTAFCAACHNAAPPRSDRLFFTPQAYWSPPLP